MHCIRSDLSLFLDISAFKINDFALFLRHGFQIFAWSCQSILFNFYPKWFLVMHFYYIFLFILFRIRNRVIWWKRINLYILGLKIKFANKKERRDQRKGEEHKIRNYTRNFLSKIIYIGKHFRIYEVLKFKYIFYSIRKINT